MVERCILLRSDVESDWTIDLKGFYFIPSMILYLGQCDESGVTISWGEKSPNSYTRIISNMIWPMPSEKLYYKDGHRVPCEENPFLDNDESFFSGEYQTIIPVFSLYDPQLNRILHFFVEWGNAGVVDFITNRGETVSIDFTSSRCMVDDSRLPTYGWKDLDIKFYVGKLIKLSQRKVLSVSLN